MSRAKTIPLLLIAALAPMAARAQGAAPPCAIPDSVAFTGNSRVSRSIIVADAGVKQGDTLNYRVVQRAIKNLYATGQFDDVQVHCDINPVTNKTTLIVHLVERPLLAGVTVNGATVFAKSSMRDKIEGPVGRPVDPALIALAVAK